MAGWLDGFFSFIIICHFILWCISGPCKQTLLSVSKWKQKKKWGNKKYTLLRAELIMVNIFFRPCESKCESHSDFGREICGPPTLLPTHKMTSVQRTNNKYEFPETKNEFESQMPNNERVKCWILLYITSTRYWLVMWLKLKCPHRRQTIHIFHFLSFFFHSVIFVLLSAPSFFIFHIIKFFSTVATIQFCFSRARSTYCHSSQ